MNSLTLLGTGTCQIQTHRIASSVLIERERERILFDIGRGVCQRLAELGIDPNSIEHIVFSHYHPDHFSDLIPFLQAAAWSRENPRSSDLHLHGSPGLLKLMKDLYELCGREAIFTDRYKLSVAEYGAGSYTIGKHDFEFASLPPAGNFGMKFVVNGQTIAITGDSSYHSAEVEFLKGVNLAIIDAGHLEIAEIIDLAVLSQPNKIICSHIYAELNQEELALQAKQAGYKGEMLVAFDKMTINLDT